jgi:hypothetical protein
MEIKAGNRVKFVGCTKEQIAWGNNNDPNVVLSKDLTYIVESVRVYSQHTKIQLKGIEGKFNSVCFECL